jgi:hypothetical protein
MPKMTFTDCCLVQLPGVEACLDEPFIALSEEVGQLQVSLCLLFTVIFSQIMGGLVFVSANRKCCLIIEPFLLFVLTEYADFCC